MRPRGLPGPPRAVLAAKRKRRFAACPEAPRVPLPARAPGVWPPAPGWAGLGCGCPAPSPAQEVSVRGQVPPLARAAASLGAAGGGNSLALTLG